MRALLRHPLGMPVWTVLGIVMLCLFIGAAIPIFAGILGNQPGRLAALPALLLLGVLLIYDYKKLLMLIISMSVVRGTLTPSRRAAARPRRVAGSAARTALRPDPDPRSMQ